MLQSDHFQRECFSSDILRNLSLYDLRFPTSLTADGSDAIHKDPDYVKKKFAVKIHVLIERQAILPHACL